MSNIEGTIIGIDVGSRRVGVARIHSHIKLSEPLDLIDTEKQDVNEAIRLVIDEYEAQAIVVGLPRGLDGQETDQTRVCRDFARDLKDSVEIPVFLIDEAGTSKAADDRRGENLKASRDSVAAAIILEDFVAVKSQTELLA